MDVQDGSLQATDGHGWMHTMVKMDGLRERRSWRWELHGFKYPSPGRRTRSHRYTHACTRDRDVTMGNVRPYIFVLDDVM